MQVAVEKDEQIQQLTHCIEMAQRMLGILQPMLDSPRNSYSLYIPQQLRRCGRSVRKLATQLEDLRYAITYALTTTKE